MSIRIEHWSDIDSDAQDAIFKRPALKDDDAIRSATAAILARVRTDGDNALRALTAEYDGVQIDNIRVEPEEFTEATASLGVEAIAAIDVSIENVRRFHEAQRPASVSVETTAGVLCERISHPLDSVGLYVPAGTAPLPSAAVMLAVPAAIAGCPTRVLCTPPRSDGSADPAVLVAAQRAGIHEVFKIGGAQAIGAMAYPFFWSFGQTRGTSCSSG